MESNWVENDQQMTLSDTLKALKNDNPSVRISPTVPRKALKRDDHLAPALQCTGKTGTETVRLDREGRW